MPLRSLTPLGKQLRSVLARVRAPRTTLDLLRLTATAAFDITRNALSCECRAQRYSSAAATEESAPVEEETLPTRVPSRRQRNRRTRVNRITEALRTSGHTALLPLIPSGKIDRSHWAHGQRNSDRKYRANAQRFQHAHIPSLAKTKEVSLSKILASYIWHRAAVPDLSYAEYLQSFHLSHAENDLLQSKQCNVDDVAAWAHIISLPNSFESAQALAQRLSARGPQSVPLFVLLNVLRRPHISARAHQVFVQQACCILDDRLANRESRLEMGQVPENTIFLLFIRLLRHAREVWPRALESVTRFLLLYLPKFMARSEDAAVPRPKTLTYMLNKAMRLISMPLAVEPFKNNRFQEAAIVQILRFMTEHDPPLQSNREGYRAVVTLQLAQAKTLGERQWADLKTLSWPPWKHERTAMDSEINPEEHGLSKAGQTLARMREAGYAPLKWEKVASIYAGWDNDGTPTIQTLKLFESDRVSIRTGTAAWCARILTTRTAQEAWACYLAYEDSKLPRSQDVYLAIFQKLHSEEDRQRATDETDRTQLKPLRRRIQSGDVREVEPLPPSTHLYTYTPTPPPTMDDLYRKLHFRGVVFQDHCLSFLIANAPSLKQGLEYFANGMLKHPRLCPLLQQDFSRILLELPMPLFNACIILLSQFPHVAVDKALPSGVCDQAISVPTLDILKGRKLNPAHPIIRAVELLKLRSPSYLPPWYAVLGALGREGVFNRMHAVFADKQGYQEPLDGVGRSAFQAILSYKLSRTIVRWMRGCDLQLSARGFHLRCLIAENMVFGCWHVFRHQIQSDRSYSLSLLREAEGAMGEWARVRPLQRAFGELVGDHLAGLRSDADQYQVHDALHVPKHLEVPTAAVLHAYVRALGFMADYQALLETVQWMVKNQDELRDRRETDRNAEDMMRRTLTALRVFLERSWIRPDTYERVNVDEGDASQMKLRTELNRLESAAWSEMIEEIRALVDGVEDWGGWATDEEVEEYCQHKRFERFARPKVVGDNSQQMPSDALQWTS